MTQSSPAPVSGQTESPQDALDNCHDTGQGGAVPPGPFLQEPTIGDVLFDLWAARLWLFAGLIFGLTGAGFFWAVSVPQHEASMVVSPSTVENTTALPAALPESAGFAIETLVRSFNPRESADFMRFETLIYGDTVAARLLKDPRILAGLRDARKWTLMSPDTPETASDLSEWLRDHLKRQPVRDTPLKRLSVLHPSAEFGVYLLNQIHNIADGHIRRTQLDRTASRIDWLKSRLEETENPQHRRALTELLIGQEQKAIILSINEPYAALVIEPPAASTETAWPSLFFVFIVFPLSGLFLGYAVYSVRRSARRRRIVPDTTHSAS